MILISWPSLAKNIIKGIALVYLVMFYGFIWLIMFLYAKLNANFSFDVSIWGEIFGSPNSLKRSQYEQQLRQRSLNLFDKTFLVLFHAIKNW